MWYKFSARPKKLYFYNGEDKPLIHHIEDIFPGANSVDIFYITEKVRSLINGSQLSPEEILWNVEHRTVFPTKEHLKKFGNKFMWYRISQQFENITKSRTPSYVTGNDQGITVNFQDYQKLKAFGTGSGPITVQDIETKQPVTVVHGGVDPEGNFAFAKGDGEFVYPENNPNWAQELGVNPGNFIVSCYEGAAKAGGFTSATNYQGKLNLNLPVNPDPNQPVKIPITGG